MRMASSEVCRWNSSFLQRRAIIENIAKKVQQENKQISLSRHFTWSTGGWKMRNGWLAVAKCSAKDKCQYERDDSKPERAVIQHRMTIGGCIGSIAELNTLSDGKDRATSKTQPNNHEENQSARRSQNPTIDRTTFSDQFRCSTIGCVGIDEDSIQGRISLEQRTHQSDQTYRAKSKTSTISTRLQRPETIMNWGIFWSIGHCRLKYKPMASAEIGMMELVNVALDRSRTDGFQKSQDRHDIHEERR